MKKYSCSLCPDLAHQAPPSMEFSRQEWVAISFSRGSSWPRDWTRVSRIGGRCFNFWATREALTCKQNTKLCSNLYTWLYSISTEDWAISLYSAAAAAAKSLQSCPTLCDPVDGSPPDSSVPGILQTKILEWVAISFSNAWKWKVKVKSLSHVRLLSTPWTAAYQAPPS